MTQKLTNANHKTTEIVMIRIGGIEKPLGEMGYDDFLQTWQDERRRLFMALSRDGKTYDEIAQKYNTTRQSVGKVLGPKKEWESVHG